MSSPVADLLEALGRGLGAIGVRWYLFGAQAVLVHGGARLTADVDATAAVGKRSTTEIAAALEVVGFSSRVEDLAAFVERTRVLPLVPAVGPAAPRVMMTPPGARLRGATRYTDRGTTARPDASSDQNHSRNPCARSHSIRSPRHTIFSASYGDAPGANFSIALRFT